MNFLKRSKASDKAEDVAVAASVQLILDEINDMYPGFKRLNKLEVEYLKSDFESLVSHRATKVLELKRLVLRILAARSEIAHMNNESSQAEAGVKVKAKDAKEEAEKLKAEVERAKKKLGRLEKDNNVAKKLERELMGKIFEMVKKNKVLKSTVAEIAGEQVEKLVERSADEIEAFNIHMQDYVNSTKEMVERMKTEQSKVDQKSKELTENIDKLEREKKMKQDNAATGDYISKMVERNKAQLEKKRQELNELMIRAKRRETRYLRKEKEKQDEYELNKKKQADEYELNKKKQAMEERERQEQMRLKSEKLKAISAAKARARVEADRKEKMERRLKEDQEKKEKLKSLKLKKKMELDKKRQALADKRKEEDERLAKHREMKRIKEEEKKAAEMAQEIQDKFAKYKREKEEEKRRQQEFEDEKLVQAERKKHEEEMKAEKKRQAEQEAKERQAKLKEARLALQQKKIALEKEKAAMEKKRESDRKKKVAADKKAEMEESKRLLRCEKLKKRLDPCIQECEKIVLEEHEPSLAQIDKCIQNLSDVMRDCEINKFENTQVLMAKKYLDRKTDPLGLYILREKRMKMDDTIEKLVNKKLLDDAKNEEISAIEAEHDSPWNLKSIVGFFGSAFSKPTSHLGNNQTSRKKYG